ncbi:dynein regulatory complex subunit 2 isoform X2 [Solenopsis invicta]|uniref:dynein regulatory complex subunit 2 isoform X2 n=1 Tax=Solenopsis invicta TaxID=13686 RepID=UPI00193E5FF6|nr:dynein regulatory complex subunit 2 isoform X2 [Solenopsis invicta]
MCFYKYTKIPPSNVKEEQRAVKWKQMQKTKDQIEREAEEHAKMLRKKQFMREIELGTLNTKRYRTLWREMMMRIKMPQIAENVEIAWRNFDRALDIKDYRISFLMDELAEAEEQYQRNTRSHIEVIDRLLRSYKKRIECEERNYRDMLNETLVQMDAEVNKIYYQKIKSEILLQSITHGMQQQMEELLNNVKSIALSKIDAFVEDSKDIRRISVAQLENQLQSSWENLRRVLSDYQNKTKNRRKCYEALKDKDEKDQQVIAQQLLRITNLFEEIRKFRGNITTYDAMVKKEISEIMMEHDFFQKASWTMKNRLSSEQTKDKNQLKILSIEYDKIIKHLERLVIKSKQLLTLIQICRKYETQDEKIIPFANHTKLKSLQTPSSHQIITSDGDVSCQVHTYILYV